MTSVGERRRTFEAAYQAHFDAVHRYAVRRTEVPEDAADVVAETFLVAWRRWSEIPYDEVRPWLYGIARNVLANHARSGRRRLRLTARVGATTTAAVVPDPAVRRTDADPVLLALSRLAEQDRELLRLVAWEDLQPQEIAVVLGVRPGAVRMRLARARERLRRALEEADPPTGRATAGDVALPSGHEPADNGLRETREVR